MNAKRWVVYITLILIILSTVLCFGLIYIENKLVSSIILSVLKDCLLGVFSGSLVSFVIGLSDYFTTRNELLFGDLREESIRLSHAYRQLDYLWFPAPRDLFIDFLNEYENNLKYKDKFVELISYDSTDKLKEWLWAQLPDVQKKSHNDNKEDYLNSYVANMFLCYQSDCKKIAEQLVVLKNCNFSSFDIVYSKIYFLKFWNNKVKVIIDDSYNFQKQCYKAVCNMAYDAQIYLTKGSKTAVMADLIYDFQSLLFEYEHNSYYETVYNMHSYNTYLFNKKILNKLFPDKQKSLSFSKKDFVVSCRYNNL